MTNFLLSVVIPIYNEEQTVDMLLKRLTRVLKGGNYELLFVDDGSGDNTAAVIKNAAKNNKQIKLVSFSRNFGHQMALACGYAYAKGDAVVSMDADLQDPPEIIPQMIEKWQTGAQIVYAKREKRDVDGFIKKITAQLFYRFINFLSDTTIPNDVGDFRLLDKEIVSFLNRLPEHSRFLRGLVAWGGYREDYVYFNREKRVAGATHYTLSRMVNFALEGITSFSIKPLRLASYLGFTAGAVGFFGIIYALLGKIFLPSHWVTGWTALFVGIMFLGGIQLITIGIIGEYVGKIYQEVQHRPRFLVREKVNL
ncbi:glycosyltransferase family 2 protein [Candidatus Roizmanbacteria bacterium]|nr:glycosyltransferase family 2 protein [Candidatus Roizmanbacteria bacterium]